MPPSLAVWKILVPLSCCVKVQVANLATLSLSKLPTLAWSKILAASNFERTCSTSWSTGLPLVQPADIICGATRIAPFLLDESCAGLTPLLQVDPGITMMPENADDSTFMIDPRPVAGSAALLNVGAVTASSLQCHSRAQLTMRCSLLAGLTCVNLARFKDSENICRAVSIDNSGIPSRRSRASW